MGAAPSAADVAFLGGRPGFFLTGTSATAAATGLTSDTGLEGTMGAFFGSGLDLARGLTGALLANALVVAFAIAVIDMAVFLIFSTALATGLTADFTAFFTVTAALPGAAALLMVLGAGFLGFCKGMAMSPVSKIFL